MKTFLLKYRGEVRQYTGLVVLGQEFLCVCQLPFDHLAMLRATELYPHLERERAYEVGGCVRVGVQGLDLTSFWVNRFLKFKGPE